MKDFKSSTFSAELQKTKQIFPLEDGYIEVRILNTRSKTVSGYYNDMEKLQKDLQRYDGNNNIFFTLNPLKAGVHARSNNHLTEYATTTTADSDIGYRKWILIDLDPVRASGISSTDDELAKAYSLSEEIEIFLTAMGFPMPVKALSGNGYHLLYPVQLPNDAESKKLVESFLKALDEKFSNENVKVDKTTFNAARITKLYGTIACKGDAIEERPHRRSCILSIPDSIDIVPVEKLQQVVGEKTTVKVKERRKEQRKEQTVESIRLDDTFCLESWLEKHQINVTQKPDFDNGKCYIFKVCPWNPEHKDRSAYIIQYNDGNILGKCHHDSCTKDGWSALWKKYEGDKSLPTSKRRDYSSKPNGAKLNPVDTLINLVEQNNHEMFQDELGNDYVQVPNGKYSANYRLYSELYIRLLNRMYYGLTRRGLSEEHQTLVLRTLSAKASFDGNIHKTYKRFAIHEGRLYYYLADEEHTVLSVSEDKIGICDNPPIRFIKSKSMKKQPMPLPGKDFLELMRKYHYFATESDAIMHDVTLIARLIKGIEQPIAIYTGRKGSSKTSSMNMDKRCLDDSAHNVLEMPEKNEDFILVMGSEDIIVFDNLDDINKNRASSFCRLFSDITVLKRTLHKNTELTAIHIHDIAIYMTTINLLSTKSDFLDRCIFLKKRPITIDEIRSKADIMNEFEADKPYIMYGMFAALSKAMKIYPEVSIKINDRLQDFLRWGYAIAEALGYGGEKFIKAYKRNRSDINEELIADDEVGEAVIQYMDEHNYFDGSMTELSRELSSIITKNGFKPTGSITTANKLSATLKNMSDNLLSVGIKVIIGKSNSKRYVKISKVDKRSVEGR